MQKMTIDKFIKYLLKDDMHYIYNPSLDRAYQFDQGEDMEILVRFRGGYGFPVEPNDQDFMDTWRYQTVMSQQEFEEFL